MLYFSYTELHLLSCYISMYCDCTCLILLNIMILFCSNFFYYTASHLDKGCNTNKSMRAQFWASTFQSCACIPASYKHWSSINQHGANLLWKGSSTILSVLGMVCITIHVYLLTYIPDDYRVTRYWPCTVLYNIMVDEYTSESQNIHYIMAIYSNTYMHVLLFNSYLATTQCISI